MPNIHGTKWGDPTLGTPGGTVTWSIAGGNELLLEFFNSPFDQNGQLWRSTDPDNFLRFDYVAVIAEAFAEWSRFGNIEFQQVPDGGGSAGGNAQGDIRIFFADLPGQILGLGAFPDPDVDIRGDIILDERGAYNTNRSLFKGLVLHEIGHALGLGHVDDDSILTPRLTEKELQRDDRDGIRAIYGNQDDGEQTYQVRSGRLKEENNDLVAVGTDGANNITGTSGRDTIDGGAGNDKLKGREGRDELRGGDGNDKLIGGSSGDILNGGADYDTVDYRGSFLGVTLDILAGTGTSGDAVGDTLIEIERVIGTRRDDIIRGDNEDSRFDGQAGNDLLEGRGGEDWLRGQAGDDTLNGDAGDDSLEGHGGHDQLNGGADQDYLHGGGGNDTLDGGTGNDEMIGSSGKDLLTGGAGDDTIKGGGSGDTFIFADAHGNDTVLDFNTRSKSEFIDFSGLTAMQDFDDVLAASTDTADGLLIDTGASDSILLNRVQLKNISEDDFLF